MRRLLASSIIQTLFLIPNTEGRQLHLQRFGTDVQAQGGLASILFPNLNTYSPDILAHEEDVVIITDPAVADPAVADPAVLGTTDPAVLETTESSSVRANSTLPTADLSTATEDAPSKEVGASDEEDPAPENAASENAAPVNAASEKAAPEKGALNADAPGAEAQESNASEAQASTDMVDIAADGDSQVTQTNHASQAGQPTERTAGEGAAVEETGGEGTGEGPGEETTAMDGRTEEAVDGTRDGAVDTTAEGVACSTEEAVGGSTEEAVAGSTEEEEGAGSVFRRWEDLPVSLIPGLGDLFGSTRNLIKGADSTQPTGAPETGGPETGGPETGGPETGGPETGGAETEDAGTGGPAKGEEAGPPPGEAGAPPGEAGAPPGEAILKSMGHSKNEAQRAFVFLYIRHRGFLMMKTWKRDKGEYFQLPGGRIEADDYRRANITLGNRESLTYDELIHVGRQAAAREVWEETRIDLSGEKQRLQFLPGVTKAVVKARRREGKKDVGYIRGTKIPRKLFFLIVFDYDEFDPSKVTLSSEHTGWTLEPDVRVAARAARKHSGGDSGRALDALEQEMAILLITQ